MGPRSSKTREDHFSLFSDLKFTSVKISNNALNFLLAQYRAIFKRAYIKGIASAVILTAGLAAGQAQATPSATDPIYTTTDDSNWTLSSGAIANVSGGRVVGDYDDGSTIDSTSVSGTTIYHNDGIVSGETLVIGASGGTIGGDVVEVSGSGSAYGGYVMIGSGSSGAALNAVAEGNKLTVASGGNITSTGNLVGGWAKTQGTGTALATGNTLKIENVETLSSGGQFIGGMAGSYNGATAKDNKVFINGISADKKLTLNNTAGNIGGIVYVGDADSGAVSGAYRAEGNIVSGSHLTVSGDSFDKNQFVGGMVTVSDLETDHTIEQLTAQGNTVELSDFSIGSTTNASGGHIVANKVVFGDGVTGTVANIEASGTTDSGITLKNGTLYASQVFGGWAESQSGGSATANANNITIIDTDLKSGGSSSLNNVIGGLAQTDFTTDQKVNLSASQNTVSFENTKYSDTNKVSKAVLGTIRGALVTLSGTSSPENAAGSTLTLDNNTVTIGAGIDVSSGSIHGAYVEVKGVTSGGATVHASNNTVTVDGNFTASDAAHTIMGVRTESGLVTAENNKLVINGKVTGDAGTQIHAVNVAEQKAIDKIAALKTITHNLSNNSVEIGATAEISNASIAAAISNNNNAYTLNNDVTIAGKVTNSDIYGGTGADSLVDVQAGSRLTYSESTDPDHYIISDNVDLGGVISVGQHDTLHIQGYANDGNIKTGAKYNTNLTNLKSTAELYNRGTVELFGDTTVAEGAKLHALVDGATIKVNGDSANQVVSGTNTLNVDLVGGRGQLTIAKAQLQSYLTAGDNYTLDNTPGTDKAGNVNITSGGVLEFTDSNIDLATLDYTTEADGAVGKIIVDSTGGTSILKGDAVTVSHALAQNGTKVADGTITLNSDGKFNTTDYDKIQKLDPTAGISIEANDLILGSSRISDKQSEDIKFNKATAKNSIGFTVGSGTFTLTSTVAGNNYMHTNDLQSDLEYFTALNGTITGDVDVVSGGEISIEYGHWTAQGDIELKADASNGGGALTVGIANTDTDARNHIANGDAALPDATLVLDQALTVNLSGAGTATVTVDGQSSGWTGDNRLGVYDEQLAQSTVGDDHYVMLDLRNGLDVIGDPAANGQLKGVFKLNASSGGVVKMMADDLNALLVQNNNAVGDNVKSGSQITISDNAHLQVTGDVSATFRDFGQGSDDSENGIRLDDGVLSANSLSLIHEHDNTAATPEESAYYATGANKIDFGSSTGTVAVQEVVINDLQRVTKPEDSTSDNDYASQVVFARGTLDIGENLSSINDTLVVGVAEGTATEANLDFYGADIVDQCRHHPCC